MRTVAFVQPKQADADAGKIREELVALCRAELARYKTPDEWIFVAEFPRNAMGKILKPVLRQQLGDGD
jgi:long-chain acyl-CoA synthetase